MLKGDAVAGGQGSPGLLRSMEEEEGGQHQADVGSTTAAQVAGELRWWLVRQVNGMRAYGSA